MIAEYAVISRCRHRRCQCNTDMHRLRAAAALWLLGIAAVCGDRSLHHLVPKNNTVNYDGRLLPVAFAPHLDALKESTADRLRAAFKHAFSGRVDSLDPVEQTVQDILEGFALGLPRVVCDWDSSISTSPAGVTDLADAGPFFIAANLFNNGDLMPHFITQLLHFIVLLPQHTVYVSVYESNSFDDTGAWLDILKQLLEALAIPHRIMAGDTLPKSEKNRIPFLAAARNKALEPLWQVADWPTHGGEHNAHHRARMTGSTPAASWPPERIIFINDVYFCALDPVRLLLHKADMACGMDWILYPEMMWANFYDNWVSRDIDGHLFSISAPHVTDAYSRQRLERGLHFPVKCCWNGMAVMNAAPFLRHGVRLRTHEPGECAASECSLLCNDFLRLGFSKMIVDPGVRLAYDAYAAQNLYTGLNAANVSFLKVPVTKWREIEANPIEESMAAVRPLYRCCAMAEETGRVPWDQGEDAVCRWDNFLVPNYTASAFAPDRTLGVQRHHRKQAAQPG